MRLSTSWQRLQAPMLTCLAVALLTPMAGAQEITTLAVSPSTPIDSRDVTLIVAGLRFCPVEARVAERSRQGDSFRFGFEVAEGCVLSPPFLGDFAFAFDLGRLPAGDYQVAIDLHSIGDGEVWAEDVATLEFRVEKSPAAVSAIEPPLAGRPIELRLSGFGPICEPEITTLVDGSSLEITARRPTDPACPLDAPTGAYSFDLEPLAALPAGVYQVEVRDGNRGARLLQTLELVVLPDPTLLQLGRYATHVDWLDFDANTGEGKPAIEPSEDSAIYWFFEPGNWELMIKVIDGCAFNGHRWVLGAASTTVAYSIEIEDTLGEQASWTFANPLGNPSPAFADIEAFACD